MLLDPLYPLWCCSVTKSCLTLCDPMDCSMPCFPVLHCLPEFAQTRVHWGNDAIQPSCYSLLLLPSVFPNIKFFSNESARHIRWPKYWSFRFSISPSGEYSGLVSFRIDWFDLLIVQGPLKSLLQHHSSKASNWYFERHHDTLNKNQVFSSTTVWRHHMILWNKNQVWYFLSNDLMMVICHT